MDFVTWCDVVLRTVHELTLASANARMTGVNDTHIDRQIFGSDALTGEFWQSQQRSAIVDAVGGLASSGLLVVRDRSNLYKVTDRGREHLDDPVPVWEQICRQKLQPDQLHLMSTLNRLSAQAGEDYACLNDVIGADLVRELDWDHHLDLLHTVAQELLQKQFIGGSVTMGLIPLLKHALFAL